MALLLLLLGRHEGVVHDALGQAVQPLADVVREVDLVLGRGDVLVVGQVAEHVVGARLGLACHLGRALQVELDLVEGGKEILHTGLELALLSRPVRAGRAPLHRGRRTLLDQAQVHTQPWDFPPCPLLLNVWKILKLNIFRTGASNFREEG